MAGNQQTDSARGQLRRPRHSSILDFARENGMLILWDYYSDPDLWLFLEYTKSDPKK